MCPVAAWAEPAACVTPGLHGNQAGSLREQRGAAGEREREALACCWYGKGHSERHAGIGEAGGKEPPSSI